MSVKVVEYDIDDNIMNEHIVFKTVVPEMIYRFIHPLKQPNFRRMYENLPASVEQLWVFGSVITENHYPWSDIDLLCIGDLSDCDKKKMLDALECECDLLVCTKDQFRKYQNQFGHCFYQILRTGIKYFDRKWLV